MDKALNLVRDLATTMGQTTAYLWPKAVLYMWAMSLGELVFEPLILTIALSFLIKAVKEGKRTGWPEEPALYFQLIPSAVVSFFAALFFAVDWVHELATVISPEGSLVLRLLGK